MPDIYSTVLPRLVRGIHDFFAAWKKKNVDGPTKSGHDEWKEGFTPMTLPDSLQSACPSTFFENG
jgi:hypothetical protein